MSMLNVKCRNIKEVQGQFQFLEPILQQLSNYPYSAPTTDLRRLVTRLKQENLGVKIDDVKALFRQFEGLGYGFIKLPKIPTDAWRFKWSRDMFVILDEIKMGLRTVESEERVEINDDGGLVRLTFPRNATDAELDRIIRIITAYKTAA